MIQSRGFRRIPATTARRTIGATASQRGAKSKRVGMKSMSPRERIISQEMSVKTSMAQLPKRTTRRIRRRDRRTDRDFSTGGRATNGTAEEGRGAEQPRQWVTYEATGFGVPHFGHRQNSAPGRFTFEGMTMRVLPARLKDGRMTPSIDRVPENHKGYGRLAASPFRSTRTLAVRAASRPCNDDRERYRSLKSRLGGIGMVVLEKGDTGTTLPEREFPRVLRRMVV